MLDKAPTNDIPQVSTDIPIPDVENIESPKLEWGHSSFNELTWNETVAQLEESNKALKDGEKKWRLPTKEELVTEFHKMKSEYEKDHKNGMGGFRMNNYWTGTTYPNYPDHVYTVYMGNGKVYEDRKDSLSKRVVCFVR